MRFVIQKHHMEKGNNHFDLRLERQDNLKCWAIPKSPDKSGKRLMIETEDHPKKWLDFEGDIEEGSGKGTVTIWDKGQYKAESWEKDKIVLSFDGEKMKGDHALIHTADEKWLLVTMQDD